MRLQGDQLNVQFRVHCDIKRVLNVDQPLMILSYRFAPGGMDLCAVAE